VHRVHPWLGARASSASPGYAYEQFPLNFAGHPYLDRNLGNFK